MELSKISSFKSFSEMRKQQDAIKTEQENTVKRVKSLEQISAILDELEISDMSTLDEEKKKALYAKLFSEDRAEEIEDEIVAKGKETDAADEVGDITGKAVADEVEEDKAEEIEADIKDLGEPKEEDPKDGEELESELDEANVTLDAMEPTEKGLVDFCKKKGIKWKVINMNGPAGGYPEVEYIGKKKDLEKMIQDFWGDDSGLEEFINEARSINKIQNDWSKITADMAKHAADWKAASAEDKPAHLELLKGLTAKKKALEAELDDAVTGKDKDLELVVTEGNAFTGALFAARNKGEKTFEFNGKTYKVSRAKKVNEEDEEVTEGNAFGDAVRKAKEAGEKEFEFDGKTYKVEEGNAFGDAVRKAKEAGEKEFEFDGKTYKVEEAITEGSHGMAPRLLKDIMNGDTSRAEGTKMSKELAAHFLSWVETSAFGKKNANLPLNMLIKASFSWGIERGLDPKLKVELAALKDSIKESLGLNEAKQFDKDVDTLIKDVKRGMGWIDPEYVGDSWENSSDAIDFALVKGEVFKRLLNAGVLFFSDDSGEEKGKPVKLGDLGGIMAMYESKVNEAEIKSDDEFKEYAMTVLKKAFGADFDEAKGTEVVDGILKKCDGDYGACVGMLTSSLGESVVTEAFDASYWEGYHEKSGKIENPNSIRLRQEVEACVEDWNDNNENGEENEVTSAGEKKVLKLAQEFVKATGYISSDVIDAMIAQES